MSSMRVSSEYSCTRCWTAAVATVGAAVQTSRSQQGRSKLQSLLQWQAELLSLGHFAKEQGGVLEMPWVDEAG
eukprot:1158815-Pelagomonas_calceolata.AAC.3